MRHKNRYLIVSIFVFLIFSISFLIYYYKNSQQNRSSNYGFIPIPNSIAPTTSLVKVTISDSITPIPSINKTKITPIPVTNITIQPPKNISNWKLYTDNQNKFTLKMPPDWNIEPRDRKDFGDDYAFITSCEVCHEGYTVENTHDNFDTYYNNSWKYCTSANTFKEECKYTNSLDIFKIDGEKALGIHSNEMGQYFVVTFHNNKMYSFAGVENDILSTIKFLD